MSSPPSNDASTDTSAAIRPLSPWGTWLLEETCGGGTDFSMLEVDGALRLTSGTSTPNRKNSYSFDMTPGSISTASSLSLSHNDDLESSRSNQNQFLDDRIPFESVIARVTPFQRQTALAPSAATSTQSTTLPLNRLALHPPSQTPPPTPTHAVGTNEHPSRPETLNSTTWKRAVLLNAPHILLETINARTAGVIIIATYVVFLVCMIIDFNTTVGTFYGSNNDIHLGSRICGARNYSLQSTGGTWGCWSSLKSWHGKVDNLSNILLVTLNVNQQNVSRINTAVNYSSNSINSSSSSSSSSSSGSSTSSDPYMYYNVDLYACFQRDGCYDKFTKTNGGSNAYNWQKVLSKSGYGQNLLESSSDKNLASANTQKQPKVGYTLFSIFQNQESLPTNGLVKSYYIQVNFLFEQVSFLPLSTLGGGDGEQEQDSSGSSGFTLTVASRPPSLGYNVATIFLFVLTVFILSIYLLIMRRKAWKDWLQEQKWIAAYLIFLIMYQNPLYIIVNFNASPGGAFAAYFFGDMAQASFLILWLCLADSINAQEMSTANFYYPKILVGLSIFLTNMIILSFQFPSFSPASMRSPVEAVYNWNSSDKLLFIGASITFLLLFWVWALIWFATLYLSKRKLGNLSYMSTRYLQLSFRFFSLQATLVTVYYILQYAATIYLIGATQPFKQNTTTLTDNINTLFRQQTQLFGKTMFLTVYAAILAFLFLPADFMENDLANSLAVNFALSEREQELLVRKRKRTIKRLESLLMNQVVHLNPHVFSVELSQSLLEVAYEAYNESAENQRHGPIIRQQSMAANLAPFGYVVVEVVENKDLDLLCLVARHVENNRLVFAFRGTRSTKNMGNNLNYAQKDIEIAELPNPRNVVQLGPSPSNHPQVPSQNSEPGVQVSIDEDAESDTSSKDEEEEDSGDNARAEGRVRGCADFSVLESALRCMRNFLRCATTNAIHVGGDMVSTAVAVTPGLNQFIKTSVHSGFWKAYEAVRDDIHRIVHKEFKSNPAHLCFTGHSLGKF